MYKKGKVNYMTERGRQALKAICIGQGYVDSCKLECRFMRTFFGYIPTSDDCDKLPENWQEECEERASGELGFDEVTEEDFTAVRANKAHKKECYRNVKRDNQKCNI